MGSDCFPPAQGDERCRQAQNITFLAFESRNATPGRPAARSDSLIPLDPARVAQPACRCAPVCPPPLNTDRLCLLFGTGFIACCGTDKHLASSRRRAPGGLTTPSRARWQQIHSHTSSTSQFHSTHPFSPPYTLSSTTIHHHQRTGSSAPPKMDTCDVFVLVCDCVWFGFVCLYMFCNLPSVL